MIWNDMMLSSELSSIAIPHNLTQVMGNLGRVWGIWTCGYAGCIHGDI